MVEWLANNWTTAIAIFWGLEKIVKLTPTPVDDILIDILWKGVKKSVGKK
jgi:hypothetical protein